MSLKDILLTNGGAVLLVMTIVQISPLKINPWSWIARAIGRALNRDLTEKLDSIDKKVHNVEGKLDNVSTKVNSLEKKVNTLDTNVNNLELKVDESERSNEERNIVLCRARMLRFGDEILHGQKHSKDHFDQILLDCTEYMNYCKTHPGFINNITEHTIDLINNTYDKCLEEKSFL